MRSLHLVSCVLLLAVTTAVHAQTDYRCVIERVEHMNNASSSVTEMFDRVYIGKEFTVERRTGLMVGVLKNSSASTTPEIVDAGSKENSFKVVSIVRAGDAGPGSAVVLLTVEEFAEGEKKPFLFVQTDIVFFGTCVHF